MYKVFYKNKGFTLIELLTVIAIIGILAVVILRSLNDARVSGIETKIKSEMGSIAKRASVNEISLGHYDTVCGSNGETQSAEITNIVTVIEKFASSTVTCNSAVNAFATSVSITGGHWCVDSVGVSKLIPVALTTSPLQLSCP